jgi:hypothetical protein
MFCLFNRRRDKGKPITKVIIKMKVIASIILDHNCFVKAMKIIEKIIV